MNSEIFLFIIDKLKNYKSSSRVTFEILESEAIQDFKKVERFVSEVKRYGAKIAIDDFGSGFANFKHMTKIKSNYIKMSLVFINDLILSLIPKSTFLLKYSSMEFFRA